MDGTTEEGEITRGEQENEDVEDEEEDLDISEDEEEEEGGDNEDYDEELSDEWVELDGEGTYEEEEGEGEEEQGEGRTDVEERHEIEVVAGYERRSKKVCLLSLLHLPISLTVSHSLLPFNIPSPTFPDTISTFPLLPSPCTSTPVSPPRLHL